MSGAKKPSRRAGFAGQPYLYWRMISAGRAGLLLCSTTRTTWKVVLQRFRPAEPALLLYYKDDLESRPTGLRGAGRTATAIAKSNRGTSPINRGSDAWIMNQSSDSGSFEGPEVPPPDHPANGLVCRRGRMNSESE